MSDLDELRHDIHQQINEDHGLYCYGKEGNNRLWSLWRESDDTQLTPWLDLGPTGFIWVLHAWDHEHKDGPARQHMLILEQEDDSSAQAKRWALMHSPSGRQTRFMFTTEPTCLDELYAGPPLLILCPETQISLDSDHGGAALYDDQFRELIAPGLAVRLRCSYEIHFFIIALRHDDQSLTWGVFDHASHSFIVPPVYADVLEHRGTWFCLCQDGGTDIYNSWGVLSGHLDHKLYYAGLDDRLFAEQNGLWGWADATGKLIGTPHAADSDALLDDPCRFARLSLQRSGAAPWCLDAGCLERLLQMVGDDGLSIKYEGVPLEDRGDGMLDINHAELPKDGTAFLLEDRWGDKRFLVLKQTWRSLAVGSVLALQGNTRASGVDEGGDDALFLRVVLDVTH